MLIGEWAKRLGLARTSLVMRIARGWSEEEILNTPRMDQMIPKNYRPTASS